MSISHSYLASLLLLCMIGSKHQVYRSTAAHVQSATAAKGAFVFQHRFICEARGIVRVLDRVQSLAVAYP